MELLVVGLNHKTAPIEVREKLAFNGPALESGVAGLVGLPEVSEAIVLSTCNRVEMYTAVHEVRAASEAIKTFISGFHSIDRGLLDESLYFHGGREAVRHAFRVAASLDSMVVGEAQILGQLKDAYEYSLGKKATAVMLNKLMKKAISVAKRVRTETRISENAVNISSVAVDLANKIFHGLAERSVLLLGAGEMAELAARHMMAGGVREIVIANRTYETACNLASQMGGRSCRFDDFPNEMAHSDIVVCSTGAPNYVVNKEQMGHVMKVRKQKPVFLIDISVPRNIDPAINDLENVFLYDVDDLSKVANENIEERKKEAEKGERIVEEEIETFLKWQASLDTVPTIVAIRERAEAIRRAEIDKTLSRMQGLDDKQRKAIEQLTSSIVNKLTHPPMAALKEDHEDKDVLVAVIRKLYGIDSDKD